MDRRAISPPEVNSEALSRAGCGEDAARGSARGSRHPGSGHVGPVERIISFLLF